MTHLLCFLVTVAILHLVTSSPILFLTDEDMDQLPLSQEGDEGGDGDMAGPQTTPRGGDGGGDGDMAGPQPPPGEGPGDADGGMAGPQPPPGEGHGSEDGGMAGPQPPPGEGHGGDGGGDGDMGGPRPPPRGGDGGGDGDMGGQRPPPRGGDGGGDGDMGGRPPPRGGDGGGDGDMGRPRPPPKGGHGGGDGDMGGPRLPPRGGDVGGDGDMDGPRHLEIGAILTAVRLMGGTEFSGRVEVVIDDVNGTVCSDGITWDVANVFCQHLNFRMAVEILADATYGEGSGDILLDGIRCPPHAKNITHCCHNEVGVTDCDHSSDLTITCTNNPEFMVPCCNDTNEDRSSCTVCRNPRDGDRSRDGDMKRPHMDEDHDRRKPSYPMGDRDDADGRQGSAMDEHEGGDSDMGGPQPPPRGGHEGGDGDMGGQRPPPRGGDGSRDGDMGGQQPPPRGGDGAGDGDMGGPQPPPRGGDGGGDGDMDGPRPPPRGGDGGGDMDGPRPPPRGADGGGDGDMGGPQPPPRGGHGGEDGDMDEPRLPPRGGDGGEDGDMGGQQPPPSGGDGDTERRPPPMGGRDGADGQQGSGMDEDRERKPPRPSMGDHEGGAHTKGKPPMPHRCPPIPGFAPEFDDIRLVGGVNESQGRLEVMIAGEWGTVCSDRFTLAAAHQFCRKLNFKTAMGVTTAGADGLADGIIMLDGVNCPEHAPSLEYCCYNEPKVTDCDHSQDVIIECTNDPEFRAPCCDEENTDAANCLMDCTPPPPPCQMEEQPKDRPPPRNHDFPPPPDFATSLVDMRLSGGTDIAGRLEVKIGDQWGTVCSHGFTLSEAIVFCRMLGFRTSTGVLDDGTIPAAPPGEEGMILLDGVKCPAHVPSFEYCCHNEIGLHDCDHTLDVGIQCSNDEEFRPLCCDDSNTNPRECLMDCRPPPKRKAHHQKLPGDRHDGPGKDDKPDGSGSDELDESKSEESEGQSGHDRPPKTDGPGEGQSGSDRAHRSDGSREGHDTPPKTDGPGEGQSGSDQSSRPDGSERRPRYDRPPRPDGPLRRCREGSSRPDGSDREGDRESDRERESEHRENSQDIKLCCDFEGGYEACIFAQGNNDKANYIWATGSNHDDTGPRHDHTTGQGHFMVLDTSEPRLRDQDMAKMLTGSVNPDSRYTCLTFWYHMSGTSVNKFDVIAANNKREVIWTCSERSDGWRQASVSIYHTSRYYLTFNAYRGDGQTGDIAFDDVMVTSRSCTNSSNTCSEGLR